MRAELGGGWSIPFGGSDPTWVCSKKQGLPEQGGLWALVIAAESDFGNALFLQAYNEGKIALELGTYHHFPQDNW